MSSLIPNLKFLVDENVQKFLFKQLKQQGFNTKSAAKGSSDITLAKISKEERRILITYDQDFQWYTKDKIFSVILLVIPQNDKPSLITTFNKLLIEFKNFSGRIILLKPEFWKDFALFEKMK